jgi:NitT/TauT family transport system permease protein/putative hydroxymethylpyrimidine transport system permease protein
VRAFGRIADPPATLSADAASTRERRRRERGHLLGALGAVAILLLLLGAWELYVALGSVDPLILPAPHTVAKALWVDRGLLWDNLRVTGGEILLGILVAGTAGFLLPLALHLSRPLRRSVYPLLVVSQVIPVVLIAPLLVTWLGFGIAPKLLIIGLVCFFPIVVTTLDALSRVDPELPKLMRTLDAPRVRVLRHVELPAALPGLFSGAKVAVTFAPIGAVFAEWTGSDAGLGHLVQQAIPQLLTARAYAAVMILSAFAIALFGLLTLAERLLVPWAKDPPGGSTR